MTYIYIYSNILTEIKIVEPERRGQMEYRGYEIEYDKILNLYIVNVFGDEVIANTVDEAKSIIDEVKE